MRPAPLIALAFVLGSAALTLVFARRTLAPPLEVAACPANARIVRYDFTLKDTAGRSVRLADYRGKVLLLDFWATWCAPCQVEIPAFVELSDKYRDRGFAALGIVVQDRFANALPFARKHRMNYPVLDADGRDDVETAFGPFLGLPTSLIVARDGRICHTHLGLPRTTPADGPIDRAVRDRFEAEIKTLL